MGLHHGLKATVWGQLLAGPTNGFVYGYSFLFPSLMDGFIFCNNFYIQKRKMEYAVEFSVR